MSHPIVETKSGPIRGTTHDGHSRFAGIPFAAPPVGALRFMPPTPVAPWSEVLNAEHLGPIVPQMPSMMDAALAPGAPHSVQDEATSLTLNIWTPHLDGSRPVMVWIHGGAFLNGAGSLPVYDGTKLAEQGDVVVVTINYRLAVFGFLHLADLGGEAFRGSGLAGSLDQVAALQWVSDNIANFGGDPSNVTVFGESAGAMSICTLLGLPAAQGLFQKAITQSGGANFCTSAEDATLNAKLIMEHAGVTTVEELQALPVQSLLDAQISLMSGGRLDMPFTPVIDNDMLPDAPLVGVRKGLGDVKLLTGSNHDEFALFALMDPRIATITREEILEEASKTVGSNAEAMLSAYESARPEATMTDILIAYMTDQMFRLPVIRMAEAQAAHGREAWMYWFTWASPAFGGILKSAHALEIPFVFDNLDAFEMLIGTGDDRQGLVDLMQPAWVRFAHEGNPGWDSYTEETRSTMRFDSTDAGVINDPLSSEREMWAGRA
ncbi:MAG: carboxylesterase family protein [Actinobacteria bacterium]|uniref:Unannotated protein n=1 Tax=freshwater metagenome TaxID=449393 RepID=A0A6J7R2T7_9ZZZZ|nr:carboxylesterase family protein [Actinomycetota bacterium]